MVVQALDLLQTVRYILAPVLTLFEPLKIVVAVEETKLCSSGASVETLTYYKRLLNKGFGKETETKHYTK